MIQWESSFLLAFTRVRSIKLAIDIGTNGEIVLGNRDRIVAASCAAGPAFEGGQIRYGMPGSRGAIDAVAIDSEGNVHLHTIDGLPPLGICGSGLVDAVSEMRKRGIVARNGQLLNNIERGHQNPARRIIKIEGQSAFLLWQGKNHSKPKRIYITQKDIRRASTRKRCSLGRYSNPGKDNWDSILGNR